uniref:Pru domain-containing protein n=1 Tax=Chromera velia CCMP2878 TaxID=1169474 RepID=A0A0G4GLP0_9ALVE|eukprot:Cvel_4875.t1-p1 / transcript=Cvel_4875.t1 / gene=Cvel_4875 / organism=Chromera_velia_CCMP2878 / gene_product=Proteasomal ubiquitin receptor ADRM1, putative / transcript_product=Proteasomal ubiquitin receptor ADRM1, putative / location=Cvel_scaffold220:22574-23422(+) / protein_length=283 / sequence_SO=supercontig / SO=protein_coding / is_pseudo=false
MGLEFRCGKMNWDGKTVTSDKRKGLLTLSVGAGNKHKLQWKDREEGSGKVEHEFLFGAGGASMTRMPGERGEKARIYVITFSEENKPKFLIWMQEPDIEADKQNVTKFNSTVAQTPTAPPPAPAAQPAGGNTGGDFAFMQQLLQQALQQTTGQQQRIQPTGLPLILNTRRLSDLLQDEEALKELQMHMPDGQHTAEDVRQVVNSSHTHASMQALTQAIYSDQLPVLLSMLGLPQPNLMQRAGGDPMEILCRSLNRDRPNANANPPAGGGGTSGEGDQKGGEKK